MLYIALLHYPVLNKEGKVVATSVANMDIHDIARAAKTYGVDGYYVIHPIAAQRDLISRIIGHWRDGWGAAFNPSRKDAFETVRLKSTLEEAVSEITDKHAAGPKVIVTGAGLDGSLLTCETLKEMIKRNHLPYLIIFGTGSGIAPEIVRGADYRLEPIKGKDGYNHLSVRAAAAIILDRVVEIS